MQPLTMCPSRPVASNIATFSQTRVRLTGCARKMSFALNRDRTDPLKTIASLISLFVFVFFNKSR
jgi:hypothetical protein